MFTKSMTIEKMDEAGTGLAKIAQLSVIDSDGDTYTPGAFSWKQGGGQWVQIIPAHDRKAMPFGKAWLYEKDDWALADLYLNLATQAGKDWHEALKFDLAKGAPIQNWSYGFQIVDYAIEQRNGDRVRNLKRLDCDEISPVIRGAGVGTGTVSIKSAQLKSAQFETLVASLGELADVVKADPGQLSATGLKQLADIHAAIGRALEAGKSGAACAGCKGEFTPDQLTDGQCAECAAKLAAEQAAAGYMHLLSRTHLRG